MASFMSTFTQGDWSPTWLLNCLMRPQFLFQSSPTCSPTVYAGLAESPPALSNTSSDGASSSCASSDGGTVISQREMLALGRIFDHFDENKDGKISRDELRRSLHMFGIETDDEELNAMIDAGDSNSDGFLDFSEFADFYHSLNEEMGQKMDPRNSSSNNTGFRTIQQKDVEDNSFRDSDNTDLGDAFRLFDKNGDGYICAEELQAVLGSMGLSQGKLLADCRNMIRSVDVDGDGQVSFTEFKQMMAAGFGEG